MIKCPQKLLFFDLSSGKICSAKICAREYYALKVFAVSNEYALNSRGFFNLYFLYFFVWLEIPFCSVQVVKKTDGGRANSDEN